MGHFPLFYILIDNDDDDLKFDSSIKNDYYSCKKKHLGKKTLHSKIEIAIWNKKLR